MTRGTTFGAALLLLGVGTLAPPGRAADSEKGEAPRVLLAASGPMREYQFLRLVLVREQVKKRAEVSVYVQPPLDKPEAKPVNTGDLPADRYLSRFPGATRDRRKENANYLLGTYTAVVAFDLDWERVTPETVKDLTEWVRGGGGLVLVAGPVHTPRLAAEPKTDKDKQVRALYPVELGEDKGKGERDKPWRLHFTEGKAGRRVLKLDPDGKGDLAGWEEFFTGHKEFDKDRPLERGFYNYYPVRSVKKGATVLATLADPSAHLADGTEQPFLVSMPLGKGRVVYLSSGELWRLRQSREGAYVQLWKQLLRYAAGAGK